MAGPTHNGPMAKSAVSLPGLSSPAVGFEQPFEMLEACHERVHRSLELLRRIVAHVDEHGHDDKSRAAVGDVLRYFDIAGPLHHQDEELHVFPALLSHPDPLVPAAVAQLQADHVRMHWLWSRLRQILLVWRDDEAAGAISDVERRLADDFINCYERHIPLEEAIAYPAAQPGFSAADLNRIGAEMAARRRG